MAGGGRKADIRQSPTQNEMPKIFVEIGVSRKSWYLGNPPIFFKTLLDLHRRMNGLHFILISFFKAEYTEKNDGNGGCRLRVFVIFHDFQSWISHERNEIKIWTLFRWWNRLAILNRIDLVRIFRVLFQITIRKWPPEKRGHFGPVEWEIAC